MAETCKELMYRVGLSEAQSCPDTPVQAVTCDSRKVTPGTIFVAIKGQAHDGHDYIEDAVKKGAVYVITDKGRLGSGIKGAEADNPRLLYAELNRFLCTSDLSAVRFVGVTGTNGKTTVCYMLRNLLEPGIATGIAGTVENRFNIKTYPCTHTTMDSAPLFAMIDDMTALGARCIVMEASSHALDQSRLGKLPLWAGAITNITQDHFDYHGNYDAYKAVKFSLADLVSDEGFLIAPEIFRKELEIRMSDKGGLITFGIDTGDVRASNIKLLLDGTEFTMVIQGTRCQIKIPYVGYHNVENFLTAAAIAVKAGVSTQEIAAKSAQMTGVPGRLESVSVSQGFHTFIDYAHTEDGLRRVLGCLKELTPGRLIVVFGCGGDRDRQKRPAMAKAAQDYADYVVVTSDNPRSEKPEKILNEIKKGFGEDFSSYALQKDRSRAIRQALLYARRGDVVVVAGKGHEDYQQVGAEKRPFSDREEILRCLNGS